MAAADVSGPSLHSSTIDENEASEGSSIIGTAHGPVANASNTANVDPFLNLRVNDSRLYFLVQNILNQKIPQSGQVHHHGNPSEQSSCCTSASLERRNSLRTILENFEQTIVGVPNGGLIPGSLASELNQVGEVDNSFRTTQLRTTDDYADWFHQKGTSFDSSYREVLKIFRQSLRRRLGLLGKEEISIIGGEWEQLQRNVYSIKCSISKTSLYFNDVVVSQLDELRESLEFLLKLLAFVQEFNKEYGDNLKRDREFRGEVRKLFKGWLTTLIEASRAVTNLVFTLTADDYLPSQRSQQSPIGKMEEYELEKLSSESYASATLYKCLCRVCPQECHEIHTAYFSLEPDGSKESTSRIQAEDSSMEITWMCQMAFQSTVTTNQSLIWLKVVSSMAHYATRESTIIPIIKSDDLNYGESVEANTSTAADLNDPIPSKPHMKRRASSPAHALRSYAKMLKIGRSSSESDVQPNAPSLPVEPPARTFASAIEVCPEYLTQHYKDTGAHAVMRMVDGTGHYHHIFYLPEDKRPSFYHPKDSQPSGARHFAPMSLMDLMHLKKLEKLSPISILYLARLIAEALLRFESFDMQGPKFRLEQRIVFYMSPSGSLKPFMTVIIQKTSQTYEMSGGKSASQREDMLLYLGFVLLQLSLDSVQNLEREGDWLPEHYRGVITRRAYETAIKQGPEFSNVVLRCADFFEHEDPNLITPEAFRERYYKEIVQPLKRKETKLIEEHKKGDSRVERLFSTFS